MKRLLFVLVAAVSFTVANAQGDLQFGVKGGLNLSTVSVSDGYSGYTYSSLANFNLGAFLKIPVTRHFSIQPELYYSGEGYKDVDQSTGYTYSEHINYLNIPVLAKYTFPVGFFLETGPQLDLKLNAKQKEAGYTTDVSTDYNSAEFAWAFGAGFKIPMAPVAVDLRYNFGITNIYNDPNYGSGPGQPGVRNGVFQLDLMFILFKARVR